MRRISRRISSSVLGTWVALLWAVELVGLDLVDLVNPCDAYIYVRDVCTPSFFKEGGGQLYGNYNTSFGGF